ncbi:ABC transporter substrate-binding protein [Cryptosporangium aurantiacum]|uniref:Carbohydrate ABC transporter substrate-binding protein, CUT1 family n=1 Tax=Cryptosporangium aurantiacum TaxID=134849 RepID=A0A1M7RNT8_9ACTN|nr:extracellular solute-binding protein [Cryptosporangium aurantiacum]SHN47766.1 carbohydrate ABC transporter substrate-binding protein, CUT1 family [Cryptosporangium aurantiacum]
MRSPLRTLLATLAAAAVLATAACGGGGDTSEDPDAKVTLRFSWWGSADRAKSTQQALDLFTKKNPNITIKTSYSAFKPYFEKLATETAGGNAPDVFQMDRAYLREYADRNVLAELDDGVTDQVAESVKDSGVVDDKLYAVPMGQTTFVMVYDPEAYQKAGLKPPAKGWTWQDYLTNGTKLTQASKGKVSGVTDLGWQWESFETWLLQSGTQLYTEDGKLGFEKADLKNYLTLIDNLRKQKASTPGKVTATIDGSIENMPMGKRLSYTENSWDSTVASYYEVLGKPVGLAPYPSDTGKLGAYAKPSMFLSISQKTKVRSASDKLVDFLVNDPEAAAILGVDRGLPPNTANRDKVGATLTGPQKAVYEYEKSIEADLVPAPPAPPKGNSALKDYWQQLNEEIAFGKLSVDKAVDEFFTRAEQELTA